MKCLVYGIWSWIYTQTNLLSLSTLYPISPNFSENPVITMGFVVFPYLVANSVYHSISLFHLFRTSEPRCVDSPHQIQRTRNNINFHLLFRYKNKRAIELCIFHGLSKGFHSTRCISLCCNCVIRRSLYAIGSGLGPSL